MKNMKTYLKTGFAQIFYCCSKKMGGCSREGVDCKSFPKVIRVQCD